MSVAAVSFKGAHPQVAVDSFLTTLHEKDSYPLVKSFGISNIVYAVCGNAEHLALFHNWAKKQPNVSPDTPALLDYMNEYQNYAKTYDLAFRDAHSNDPILLVIMAWPTRVFALEGMFVRHVDNFEAIGAGAPIAKGAMHLGHSAAEAVAAAAAVNPWCGFPISVWEYGDKESFDGSTYRTWNYRSVDQLKDIVP